MALKGEDIEKFGLAPAVQKEFGVPPQQTTQLDPQLQDMAHKEAVHQQTMRQADEKHRFDMQSAKDKTQMNGAP